MSLAIPTAYESDGSQPKEVHRVRVCCGDLGLLDFLYFAFCVKKIFRTLNPHTIDLFSGKTRDLGIKVFFRAFEQQHRWFFL